MEAPATPLQRQRCVPATCNCGWPGQAPALLSTGGLEKLDLNVPLGQLVGISPKPHCVISSLLLYDKLPQA